MLVTRLLLLIVLLTICHFHACKSAKVWQRCVKCIFIMRESDNESQLSSLQTIASLCFYVPIMAFFLLLSVGFSFCNSAMAQHNTYNSYNTILAILDSWHLFQSAYLTSY